ncbi:uncharacterized protein LOC111611598 isoform X2 [Xiphophorus maculatus]|uniref:uncharacterized protein LOC111611598 isoform X2 n=1 Tax=Xiphophorus maculatus TaxID=8083 RepID=UPI000C6E9893|nr:uncharacterized protein LOC111611598 isoform X2 [Xiphophorus maculatus]
MQNQFREMDLVLLTLPQKLKDADLELSPASSGLSHAPSCLNTASSGLSPAPSCLSPASSAFRLTADVEAACRLLGRFQNLRLRSDTRSHEIRKSEKF